MALEELTHNTARFKRMRYQSWHRGCKETDVILGSFFDKHAPDFSEEEFELYEALLNEDDWDIWQWVAYSQAPPNTRFTPIINRLREFHTYADF